MANPAVCISNALNIEAYAGGNGAINIGVDATSLLQAFTNEGTGDCEWAEGERNDFSFFIRRVNSTDAINQARESSAVFSAYVSGR